MNTTELIARLKAAAQEAKWGDWEAYKPHKGARGYEVKCGVHAVAQHCLKAEAEFIAQASPKAVLALLAERDADKRVIADSVVLFETLHQRITELEGRAIKFPPKVDRDDSDGYWMLKGQRVSAANAAYYNEALKDVALALFAAGIKCEVKGE